MLGTRAGVTVSLSRAKLFLDPHDLLLFKLPAVALPVVALGGVSAIHVSSVRHYAAEHNLAICTLAPVDRAPAGRSSEIHRDLRRCGTSGFQFERDRPPAEDPRRTMHSIKPPI